MKKFKIAKLLVVGFVLGFLLMGTTILATGTIRSATFNSNIVIFNGTQLNLDMPLISVVLEESPDFSSNYMPVRAVLEAMGYTVGWDGENSAILITSPVAGTDPTSAPLSQPHSPPQQMPLATQSPAQTPQRDLTGFATGVEMIERLSHVLINLRGSDIVFQSSCTTTQLTFANAIYGYAVSAIQHPDLSLTAFFYQGALWMHEAQATVVAQWIIDNTLE